MLVTMFAACGGGGDTTPTPPGGFSIAVSPTSATMSAASVHIYSVSITRTGSFSGTVALRVDNAPAGVTTDISPASVPSGTTSADFQVAVAATTVPGTYPLTIVGSATGQSSQSATFTLIVTPQPGSFALGLTPGALSVRQNQSGATTVTVTRTGSFAGAVALALENTPNGVSGAFAPASIAAGSTTATLTISATGAATPGTYAVIVRGTGSGVADQTLALSLTVTLDPGSFAIGLAPTALTVRQGLTGATTVTVTRTAPFAGAVTLALEGAPTGVSGAFAPTSIAAGSTTATLTISVTGAAAPGPYTLTIRATGSGVAEQTTTLSLTVTPDPGSFTIAASPSSVSIEQGLNGAATVSVTRVAPFTGAVSLVLTGLPAGVTASPSPISIAAGAPSTTITLTVGAAVATGNYPITIRGSANGVPDAVTTLTLTVTLSAGGFTLTAAPAFVQQGQIGAVTITIARVAPFTGAVNLNVEGAPAGVTPSLVPAIIPAGQTSTQLTYSVLATVPTSVYPIIIRGTATGVSAQQVTQNLTVTAPPAGNVTFQFCNPALRPVWFGYQDGTAQWTQVAGANGSFSFSITAAKGGAAFVVPVALTGGAGYDVMVVLGTRAELIEAGNQSCGKTPSLKTLNGTLAGRGVFDVVNVAIGAGFVQVQPTAGPGFQMLDAELGARDLFAVRSTFTSPVPPSMVILRRNTNYAANSTIPLLDFSSVEAFATTTQTVTTVNGGSDELRLRQAYVTAGGTIGLFPTVLLTANPGTYQVLPPGAILAGDLYSLRLEAREDPGDPLARVVSGTFANASAQALALGPALTPPTTSDLQAAPFYQVRVQSTVQPEYNKAYFGRYRQPTRTGAFYATAGYIGGVAIDITTPDLTTVPGWNALWGPLPGVSTTTSITGFGWTGTSSTLFPGWFGEVVVEAGVVLRSASLYDVITP